LALLFIIAALLVDDIGMGSIPYSPFTVRGSCQFAAITG
jgi:hypothetical protein